MALQLLADEPRDPFRLFDTYSEQKMNLHLKNIASDSGIKKAITTHCGRHTFATIFLRRTKNIPALQKILGHSKIEQTMEYVHILTEDIEGEVSEAFSDFSTRQTTF